MTQDEALRILKKGHNVFLTGAAGSGKTYLLNKYIHYLKSIRARVAITASTGIAATHLEGITIHSWSGIGLLREATDRQIESIVARRYIAQRLRKTEVLIIDEISMLDADRLDLLEKLVKTATGSDEPFGGMQVVLCGDFFQLPPVAGNGEPWPRPVYLSEAWENMDLKVCYLGEQHRHEDQEFLLILNAIRDASVDGAIVDRLRQCRTTSFPANSAARFVRLYTHNADVDRENVRELASIDSRERRYTMALSGVPAIAEALKGGCLAPENLVVKRGASVMFVKNNFEKGYVNGTLGIVRGFSEDGFPVVSLINGAEIVAEPATWSVEENGRMLAQAVQVPLRLAWAITVHKSQGMTLDAVQVDLSKCFEKGMGYVALSRVRSLRGLRLLAFNDIALQVSDEALEFDRELRDSSETALGELSPPLKPAEKSEQNEKPYSVESIRQKYPSAYKKWTPYEESKLASEFRAGKSIDKIAEALGREPGGIRSRLKKLEMLD